MFLLYKNSLFVVGGGNTANSSPCISGDSFVARSSPGKYDSLSKLVTQTLMLAIVSCIVAGLVTYVVSLGLNHSGAINNVTVKQNQLQILFIVYDHIYFCDDCVYVLKLTKRVIGKNLTLQRNFPPKHQHQNMGWVGKSVAGPKRKRRWPMTALRM